MRNFYFFRQLLFGLCCAATLLVTTRSVNAAGPAGKEERASIGRPLPGWFQPGLPLSARLAWLSSFGQLTNDDDPKNGNDPIRFFLTSDKREVTLGEEVEIKVVAELMDIHPSSLFVMEGSNGFTIKVVFPDGFRQTGGTYTDYVGDQLTRDRPIREYTIRGVFERMPPHSNFQLLRGPSGAAAGSVFAYKRTHTVYVYNKELAGGRESAPSVAKPEVATPVKRDSVGELATSATCTASINVIRGSIYCDGTTIIPALFQAQNCQPGTVQWDFRPMVYDYVQRRYSGGTEFQMTEPGWLIMRCTPVGCSQTYTSPENYYMNNQPRGGGRFYNLPDCSGEFLSTISAIGPCPTQRARFLQKLSALDVSLPTDAEKFSIRPDTTRYRAYSSECLDLCGQATTGAYTWYIPPVPTAKDFIVWVKETSLDANTDDISLPTLTQVRSGNSARIDYDGTRTLSVWSEGCINGTIYVDGVAASPKKLPVPEYKGSNYSNWVRDYLTVRRINPVRQYIEISCKTNCSEVTAAKVYLGGQTSSGFKLFTDKDEVCAGDSTTLSAFGCSAGTLKWLSNMTLQSDRSVAKPTVGTWYKATCTLSGVTYRDSVFVNVAAVPTVRPGISAKNLKTNVTVTSSGQTTLDLDFDYGSSIQLTASGCPAGNSVTWYNNQRGLLSALTGTTVTVTPEDITQYWSRCKNSAGCEGPVSTKIQTKPRVTNIEAYVNAVKTPIIMCAAMPASLTATGCGGDVRWFLDDGDGNRLNDVLVDSTKELVSRPVPRSYSAKYYAACSFGGKDVAYSNTVEVAVPAATVTIEGGGQNVVCRNTPVTLVAKGCHPSANLFWYRKDGTNWVSASETPTRNGEVSYLSVAPSVATTYKANCKTPGCESESNSLQVNVVAASTATPDAKMGTVPTRKICIGKPFTLFVANPGINDVGYVWQAPNGGKTFGDPKSRAGADVLSLTMEPAYNGTWTLLIYDGCSTTPIQKTIEITASKQIFVTAFKYDVTGNKIKIYNSSYLVTNNGQVTSGLKYRWDFGDYTAIDTLSRDPEHTYASARGYQVGLTVINTEDGCDASLSQAVTVGCTRPAAPVITQTGVSGSATTVCSGQSLTLQASGCAQTAVWFVNNRTDKIAEATTLNVTGTLTQPGQYQLVAMCKNGTGPDACQSDLSAPFTVTITSPPTPVVRVKDNKTGTFLSSTATYTPGQVLTVSAEGCDAYGTVRWVALKGTDTLSVPQGSAFTFPLVGLTTSQNQQYKFSAFCRQSSATTTCQSTQSAVSQLTVGTCPAVTVTASAPITSGIVTVCSGTELKLTASGGNGLYDWYRDSLKVASGTDFYPSTTGKYRAVSCQGSVSTSFVTVVLLAAEVAITPADTTVKAGSSMVISAKDITPVGSQAYTNKYAWIGPGATGTTQTFVSLNTIRPDQAGTYKVTLSKTANGVTCVSSASARVTVQAADCNLKITEPLVTCGTGGATLKVNYTGGNPALNRQFSLDGITYQSDSLFRNLKDSTYTLYLRERSGDQGQVCQAASKEAMVFCDTVGACEISILSKDENGKLTEVMARGTNNELRPITLSVLMGSGKPLSSTTKYEWTGPGNFRATTATVLAKFIGTYLVQIKRGNIVCTDSVRLTAGPCGNAVPVSSCGSNGNFTAVPDEVSNRLTSLIIGDKIQAGDFEITVTGITSGGPGGWNGRGYTSIPYMNTVVAVELKNAVVNSCYQLTMGNALPGTPTVESIYDTNWGSGLDLDNLASGASEGVSVLRDLFSTYQGSSSQKASIDASLQKMQQDITSSSLYTEEEKSQLLAKFSEISADWNNLKNCASPGGRANASNCGSTENILAKYDALQGAMNNNKPTNVKPPEIPYTAGTYIDIPVYWLGQKGYKTNPTAIDRVNCDQGSIFQYTLYHPDRANNPDKLWWIRELGVGAGCQYRQFYYYREGQWILFFDEKASIDGHRQAMYEAVEHLGMTFEIIAGLVMGPEDIVIEGGAVVLSKAAPLVSKAALASKAAKVSEAISIFMKERKAAAQSNKTLSKIRDWWDDLLKKGVGKYYDQILESQRALVLQFKSSFPGLSNQQKGNLGEMVSDITLTDKGLKPLHNRLTDLNAATRQGADGVFEKNGIYYIVESKYNTSRLKTLTGGVKQMSKSWIESNQFERLRMAGVDQAAINQIAVSGYTPVLAKVSETGDVVYRLLDNAANDIGAIIF